MKLIINIIQIFVSVLLVMSILLQTKGTGLGSTFGGSGEAFRTKRGMEKVMHTATIILALIFFILSLLSFLLR